MYGILFFILKLICLDLADNGTSLFISIAQDCSSCVEALLSKKESLITTGVFGGVRHNRLLAVMEDIVRGTPAGDPTTPPSDTPGTPSDPEPPHGDVSTDPDDSAAEPGQMPKTTNTEVGA